MQSIAELASALTSPPVQHDGVEAQKNRANRVRWLKLNFTVKAARLQTLKRQKYQHLQEEALLKARGLLKNWENGVVVLTEDLYRRAAGERDAQELMNYTPEALALRFSLRNDPQVLEAIKSLWQIEMARDPLGCIDQRGYASVFRRVAKSLDEKEFKKKQKLDRLLDEDWKRDSKGEPSMSFANFFDSIFELADLWCETINASDYVEFLERLRDRISQVRRGKRVFKPLGKVTAFDGDSDEDEEEEEEEDESDEDEPSERSKPKVAASAPVQPRLLVAKAIRPAPQPQKQPLNLLGKVTRVAMTSKGIHRKPGSGTGQMATPNATPATVVTTLSEIVVPTASASLTTSIPSDTVTVAPLIPMQSVAQLAGMASRQRRASVVTTIQFLDDGFVRSISEGLGNGGTGGNQGSPGQPSMYHAAAGAFSTAKREQQLRPSLATAAAVALGRTGSRHSTQTNNGESGAFHDDLASISESQKLHKTPEPQRGSADRKRVITVSTSKRAMLKSIVFATTRKGSHEAATPRRDDASLLPMDERRGDLEDDAEQGDTVAQRPIEEDDDASAVANNTNRGARTGGGGASANGMAVRVRTGSVFNGGPSSAARAITGALSKGPRQGFATAAAAARARSGLAPLSPPGTNGVINTSAGLDTGNGGKNTVRLNSIAQTIMTQGSGGIDLSDTVMMSSYVTGRPSTNLTLHRPSKVLGPPATVKKPPLAAVLNIQRGDHEEGVLRGQRAMPKQTTQLQQPQPLVIEESEAAANRPMLAVMHKPPLPTDAIPSSTAQPHRYVGHALHSQGPSASGQPLGPLASTPPGPEGAPERALRIKAALDLEGSHQNHGHKVRAPHDHVYDHTEPGARQLPPFEDASHDFRPKAEHGMRIQSFAEAKRSPASSKSKSSASSKLWSRQQPSIDPLASPWDTFDDDDDDNDVSGVANSSVSSARSLLQPESATEALAKVISKRAASLSAGATRAGGRHGLPSSETSGKRQRSRPSSTNLYSERAGGVINDDGADSDDDGYAHEDEIASPPVRSRVLSVSSLGGRSVESRRNDFQGVRQHLTKRGSREIDTEVIGMRESVSSPVLMTMTALELDCSTQPSTLKARGTTSHSKTREGRPQLARIPSTGITSMDDFELRGEHAFDSPPRSPPTRAASPPKKCTCSRSHEPESLDGDTLITSSYPPPRYRLERTETPSKDDSGDHGRPGSPDVRCALCSRVRDTDATIIVNAKRELTLEPRPKEDDVIAQASQEMPRRSDMMRRRHRYTRGKQS